MKGKLIRSIEWMINKYSGPLTHILDTTVKFLYRLYYSAGADCTIARVVAAFYDILKRLRFQFHAIRKSLQPLVTNYITIE